MNFTERLKKTLNVQGSYVCVGLDTDVTRIPQGIPGDTAERIVGFNRAVIDATADYASAFKFNSAFYEAAGAAGCEALRESIGLVPEGIIRILDAKRGDIGNTSAQYFRALVDVFQADAITVNPYMGRDSVEPFFAEEHRGVFLLCLTSNRGSVDFQKLALGDGRPLYMEVARKIVEWNTRKNLCMVVGATHPEELVQVREVAPDMPLLIPGIGAQRGDLEKTVRAGVGSGRAPALINSSRGIIYASSGDDFAAASGKKCRDLRDRINEIISAL